MKKLLRFNQKSSYISKNGAAYTFKIVVLVLKVAKNTYIERGREKKSNHDEKIYIYLNNIFDLRFNQFISVKFI